MMDRISVAVFSDKICYDRLIGETVLDIFCLTAVIKM